MSAPSSLDCALRRARMLRLVDVTFLVPGNFQTIGHWGQPQRSLSFFMALKISKQATTYRLQTEVPS